MSLGLTHFKNEYSCLSYLCVYTYTSSFTQKYLYTYIYFTYKSWKFSQYIKDISVVIHFLHFFISHKCLLNITIAHVFLKNRQFSFGSIQLLLVNHLWAEDCNNYKECNVKVKHSYIPTQITTFSWSSIDLSSYRCFKYAKGTIIDYLYSHVVYLIFYFQLIDQFFPKMYRNNVHNWMKEN